MMLQKVQLPSSVNNVALTDSPTNLAGAFAGITSYTANLSLNDDHTTAQLVTINNATTGTISTNGDVTLVGTGAQVSQAVANFGTDGYGGCFTQHFSNHH